MRKPLFLALAVALALLLEPSRAHAQGGLSGSITSVSPDGSLSMSRTATIQSTSSAAHWDPYRGQWVGGKYGYGPRPASDRYPYYGERYGSPTYSYYGGYVSGSVYASGLRTGLYNVP